MPVGHIVAEELTAKLGVSVDLDWHRLAASDVQGRARAFSSLTGGGMSVKDAAEATGFDLTETVPPAAAADPTA